MAARQADSPMPSTARVQQPSLTEVLDRGAAVQCMHELAQVDATLAEPRIDSQLSNQAGYDLLRTTPGIWKVLGACLRLKRPWTRSCNAGLDKPKRIESLLCRKGRMKAV